MEDLDAFMENKGDDAPSQFICSNRLDVHVRDQQPWPFPAL